MLLSTDEVRMLSALSDAEGLTQSDYLRKAIRDAFRRYAKDTGKPIAEAIAELALLGVSGEAEGDHSLLERTRGARVDISPIGEDGFSLDMSDEFEAHEKEIRRMLKAFSFGGRSHEHLANFSPKLSRQLSGVLGTRVRLVDPHNTSIFGVKRREVRFSDK